MPPIILKAKSSDAKLTCHAREWREYRELTLLEVGKAIGMQKAGVGKIERGLVDPPLSTAMRLASFYGCDVNDLWTLE